MIGLTDGLCTGEPRVVGPREVKDGSDGRVEEPFAAASLKELLPGDRASPWLRLWMLNER